MMSLISPRHGLHHVAQKLRKTGWPRRCDKVTVSPANVLSEKSGATASRPWAEGRAAAMTSTTHMIASGRKPAPGCRRTESELPRRRGTSQGVYFGALIREVE